MSFDPTLGKYEVRVLDPKTVRLFRSDPKDSTVRMTLNEEVSWREVRIARAFPFSDALHYIGLRDGTDAEIGMMENLDGMDAESLAIVGEEIERRYFTPKVNRVLSVSEMQGTVNWEVETNRGVRRFVVRNIRDNAYSLGPNRLMMTDTEGNRYEFPDVSSVSPKAYAIISRVM